MSSELSEELFSGGVRPKDMRAKSRRRKRFIALLGACITALGLAGAILHRSSPARVVHVAAGRAHVMLLKSDGTVWTAGDSSYGQLGYDDADPANAFDNTDTGIIGALKRFFGSRPVPFRHVEGRPDPARQVPNLRDVTAISGYDHTVVVKKDGTVWTFGYNDSGQLGYKTGEMQNFNPQPKLVPGLNNIVAVAAGVEHTVALKRDGTIWTFGSNNFEQLGYKTIPDEQTHSTPKQVPGLTNVIAIAAGYQHTVALKRDGTIWTFGNNDFGQLGFSSGAAPHQVPGLTDITAIAAGFRFTVALTNDGKVWTFGENDEGQLGYKTASVGEPPKQIPAMSNITAITAGFALKRDGTATVFGVPVRQHSDGTAAALTEIAAISASYSATVILKRDGTVLSYGIDYYEESAE